MDYIYKFKKYSSKMNNVLNGGLNIIIDCNNKKCYDDVKETINFNKNKVICIKDFVFVTKTEKNMSLLLTIYSKLTIVFENEKFLQYEEKFKIISKISSGVYGVVYLYRSQSNKYIAIKYGKIYEKIQKVNNSNVSIIVNPLDDDINVINVLKKSKICDNIIISCHVDINRAPWQTHDTKSLFMEYMDNTLDCAVKKSMLNEKSLANIIVQLLKIAKCLYDKNIYYTDMKLINILFKCTDDNNANMLLCDFGGIASIDEKNENIIGLATFPPLLYELGDNLNGNTGIIKNPTIEHVLWVFGITILTIICDYSPFYHKTINTIKNEIHNNNNKINNYITGYNVIIENKIKLLSDRFTDKNNANFIISIMSLILKMDKYTFNNGEPRLSANDIEMIESLVDEFDLYNKKTLNELSPL
jgi:serine/threonine protein kinase